MAAFRENACGDTDSALMHACIAVDATAKKLFPSEISSARRFVRCVRQYYWLIEPMIGVGFNLAEIRFGNIASRPKGPPDLAEFIYEEIRCAHTHGQEVRSRYLLTPYEGGFGSTWEFGPDRLHVPQRLLWALVGLVVVSRVNAGTKSTGTCFLSLGEDRYPVAQWWGREADFRHIADRWNTCRITLERLDRLRAENRGVAGAVIIPPPPLGGT